MKPSLSRYVTKTSGGTDRLHHPTVAMLTRTRQGVYALVTLYVSCYCCWQVRAFYMYCFSSLVIYKNTVFDCSVCLQLHMQFFARFYLWPQHTGGVNLCFVFLETFYDVHATLPTTICPALNFITNDVKHAVSTVAWKNLSVGHNVQRQQSLWITKAQRKSEVIPKGCFPFY